MPFSEPLQAFACPGQSYNEPCCFVAVGGTHIAKLAIERNQKGETVLTLGWIKRFFNDPKKKKKKSKKQEIDPFVLAFDWEEPTPTYNLIAGNNDHLLYQTPKGKVFCMLDGNTSSRFKLGNFGHCNAFISGPTQQCSIISLEYGYEDQLHRWKMDKLGIVVHEKIVLPSPIMGITPVSRRMSDKLVLYNGQEGALHFMDARESLYSRKLFTKGLAVPEFSIAAFHPDANYFATVNEQGQINTYFTSGMRRGSLFTADGFRAPQPETLQFSPDGTLLGCVSQGALYIIEMGLDEGRVSQRISLPSQYRPEMGFSSSSRWFFVATSDKVFAYPISKDRP